MSAQGHSTQARSRVGAKLLLGVTALSAAALLAWTPFAQLLQIVKSGALVGFLIVFLGGGLGAALRHGVNLLSARTLGAAFPYATAFENVTGSLAMGLIAGYFAFRSGGAHQHWQLFLTTGILGGYTTFSTFSLDAVLLYERGAVGLAALYVLGSAILSIAGLMAGLALARQLL
jgi:fluoride exporter